MSTGSSGLTRVRLRAPRVAAAPYTGLTPGWLACGGFDIAAVLPLGSNYSDWSGVVLPFRGLLVSISICLQRDGGEGRP